MVIIAPATKGSVPFRRRRTAVAIVYERRLKPLCPSLFLSL